MASVTDASKIQRKVERERQKLSSANIPERDREAIEGFVRHRRVHGTKSGSYAPSSERADLNKLRLSAERAETTLVDMGLDDLNALLELLKAPKDAGGYGIERGIDSYTRALRLLFGWLDDHDEYGDYGWWEKVKTGNVDFPEPNEREFPTQSQIEAMKRAAGRRGTLRDVAMVSFYADTAVRRTLGAQLTIDCIDLTGTRLEYSPGAFQPNPEGEAQKGVEVKWYPLHDCVADLRTWMNRYHPEPENDDAPLWTVPDYHERRDPGFCHHCSTDLDGEPDRCPVVDDETGETCGERVYDDGAITTRYINDLFKKYARAAGIDTDAVEVKPHGFRHAAVGRWKEQEYSLPQVQRRTAWKDKAAAEMWAKYGDPDDSALDKGIAEKEGATPVEPNDEDGEQSKSKPEPRECGNCRATDIRSDHCPDCGYPVSPEALEKAAEERTVERERARAERIEAALGGMEEVMDALEAGEELPEDALAAVAASDEVLAVLVEQRAALMAAGEIPDGPRIETPGESSIS